LAINHGEKNYRLKALTDVWTGGFDKGSNDLIATGLLGSVRWWYEVLVRGLNGSACDPANAKSKCVDRDHCAVCELFGCTGWARKFRFQVLDQQGGVKMDQIRQNQIFSLRFTPLRPIRPEEWALLEATLSLIAKCGAMGGKTVYKPSDEPNRAKQQQHRDYGLVEMSTPRQFTEIRRVDVENYLLKYGKVDHDQFDWASLRHFWCVHEKYLGRASLNISTFNKVLGRHQAKSDARSMTQDRQELEMAIWLAGEQQVSKKIFSFKEPARTFGFVKPRLIDFDIMKKRLTNAWGQSGWDFLTGDRIIEQLFAEKGGDS
jgi:CRISPR-associated protein Cmr1